jgi:protease IV
VVKELASRAGLEVHTLTRGESATWLSPFAPFTPQERRRFESMLRETYDRFLERISIGRQRGVAELHKAAEGRVMGGERARALGLVDETGGLARAMQIARERGKLGPRAPVVTWPDQNDAMRALSSLISAQHSVHALDATVAEDLRAARPLTTSPLMTVLAESGEPVAATPPFVLRVY